MFRFLLTNNWILSTRVSRDQDLSYNRYIGINIIMIIIKKESTFEQGKLRYMCMRMYVV